MSLGSRYRCAAADASSERTPARGLRYPPCTPNTSPNTSPTPKGLNSAPQRHAMRAVGGALLGNRSRHSAQSAPAGGFFGDCTGKEPDQRDSRLRLCAPSGATQYSKRSQLNTQFPGSCCSPSSTTRSPKATRTPNRTTSSLHCSYSSTDGRASRNRGTRKSDEVLSIVVAHFYYSTAVIT